MRAAAILLMLILPSLSAAQSRGTGSLGATAPASARAGKADAADVDPDDGEVDGGRVPVVGPPIGAVLSAAYTAAGLDHDPTGGWIRRTRLAGLVPWVTVRTARDTSWQDTHAEVGHGTSLEVRATWRLDRLVFDSHELQVSAISAARRRERQRLASRVIRSYFAWRRAAGGAPGPGDARSDRVTARVAETAAELDALTDGWFSDEVARLDRGTPEPRDAAPRTPWAGPGHEILRPPPADAKILGGDRPGTRGPSLRT